MKDDYFKGLSEEGFHKVAYTEWGKATDNDIPIICVHGLSRNRHDFDSLATYLAKQGVHTFSPDVVGRGDSDWLKNPLHYTYEQYILDMNNMIARTGAHQVDWVGTSMGGLIGMILAAQANSPIRRLVLNDIGPQIPVKGIQRLSMYSGRDPTFISVEEAKKYFRRVYSDIGNLTDEQWQHFTESSIHEESPGKFVTKIDQGVKMTPAKSKIAWHALLHPYKALEGTLFDVDLWSMWRTVTCPVLVIHGSKSDMLSPQIIQKMQAIHPNTDLLEMPDVGHAPALLDEPEQAFIYHWLMKP